VAAVAPDHVPGQPLEYDGLREHYLPEVEFRSRVEHRNSQYALYAAACMRGGLRPDLLSDAGWWQKPLPGTPGPPGRRLASLANPAQVRSGP